MNQSNVSNFKVAEEKVTALKLWIMMHSSSLISLMYWASGRKWLSVFERQPRPLDNLDNHLPLKGTPPSQGGDYD
jgi:hypothetical protein